MAHETSKQATRRGADRRYATRWLTGDGIDIGCGADSLGALGSFFPLMRSVRPWDLPDGDAMEMIGVADDSFDFVHSSHCLEHLVDPYRSLDNWIRICRPGGHVVVSIPDEDLYEQGVWPSTFNADHKWSFTIGKRESWSPRSVNVIDLLSRFLDRVDILKIELLDSGFRYGQGRVDQSMGILSESAIEFVLRKKPASSGADTAADLETLFEQALASHQAGQSDRAQDLYRAILDRDPSHASSLNNLAMLMPGDAAIPLLQRAVAVRPDFLQARSNLGRLQLALGRFQAATEAFRALAAAQPDDAGHWRLLAESLEGQGAVADAIAAQSRAVALCPGDGDHAIVLARLFERDNQPAQVIACADAVLATDDGHQPARILRAHAKLKLGDFGAGTDDLRGIWPDGRWADQLNMFARGGRGRPALRGQRVLLSSDSGFGDAIQFVRYAAALKARKAVVVVEVQPELVRLMSLVPEIDEVVAQGQPLPAHDLRVPLHNLMGAFGTTLGTVPASVPYLVAPEPETAAWERRLADYPGLKVGLVWAGNAAHVHDARRSIDPDLLAPLTRIDGVTLVSLQRGAAATLPGLVDWTDGLVDFAATGALVEALDLVISIDSAVAHLAGALGRPVWLLNRFDGCWRWLMDRPDSPWYPTMRIYRQPAAGDWSSVADVVGRDLKTLVEAARQRGADRDMAVATSS